METKLKACRVEKIKMRLSFERCFVVEPIGRGGGLALMWRDDIYLEILNYSQRHISAWVIEEEDKMKWLMTVFNGHPKASKRHEAWNLLISLKPSNNQACCVIRDFNKIVTNDEKIGANQGGK